jgi:hypothetical protein
MLARNLALCYLAILAAGALYSERFFLVSPPATSDRSVLEAALSPAPGSGVEGFWGTWETRGAAGLPKLLAIEDIHPDWATISFLWEQPARFLFPTSWERIKAEVLADGTIRWGSLTRFTLRLNADGVSALCTREQAGSVRRFSLRRAGASGFWGPVELWFAPATGRRENSY